jgi:trafficking protein particle complex subunit 2
MSYYFAIIGTQDNPLFEYEFGTAKQGGDGIARFPQEARHMNQFIVHSSLDIVEEVQWGSGQMYVSTTAFQGLLGADYVVIGILGVSTVSTTTTYPASSREGVSLPVLPAPKTCTHVSADAKFLLLHSPSQPAVTNTTRASTSIAANPTSPQTEEAIKLFFTEVYENWVKTIMNPFYQVNMEVKSPVFRGRVAAAGKKYL